MQCAYSMDVFNTSLIWVRCQTFGNEQISLMYEKCMGCEQTKMFFAIF